MLEGKRDATRKSMSEKGTERDRARNERQRKRKGKETSKMRERDHKKVDGRPTYRRVHR